MKIRALAASLLLASSITVGLPGSASPPGEPPAPPACASTGTANTWASKYWCETPWSNGIGQKFVRVPGTQHLWRYTLDPTIDGATGFIEFDDRLNPTVPESQTVTHVDDTNAFPNGAMLGPQGAGVNDWQLTNPITGIRGFDFDRPSFTQDVTIVPPDYITADPVNGGSDQIWSDYDAGSFAASLNPPRVPFFNFPRNNDVNMDSALNFYKFGWTTPAGTQFNNMQIDRAGNYFVAKRDMQWGWFDKLEYVKYQANPNGVASSGGFQSTLDSQFNIQPYPISNAYGWCGIQNGKILDPDSNVPMAGQITFDVAFDAYPVNTGPGSGSTRPMTVVVPGFVMRSYGKVTVDVTMVANGVRQQLAHVAKPNNLTPSFKTIYDPSDPTRMTVKSGTDPEFGLPWSHWKNNVMAFGAGVVPAGAWVVNEFSPNLKVVPAGTPGATWHSNGPFTGAAFIVRGDIRREARYTQTLPSGSSGLESGPQYLGNVPYSAWSDYPAPAGYFPEG